MWNLKERHDSEVQMKKPAVFPQRGNLGDEKQILRHKGRAFIL